jgi:hypothetical protein
MQPVSHSTTIQVNATPDETLPLFTAAGERLWIKEWQPTYIYPEDGEPKQGMIWKTTNDANIEEIWVTVNYDVVQHTATYVKWSPENNVTRIDVQCSPIDGGQTEVQVTYTITPLSEKGVHGLKSFTKAHYEHWIKAWEKAINHYLQHGEATSFH